MELKCDFQYRDWIVGSTTKKLYTCYVRDQKLAPSRVSILAFNATHLSSKSNKDIEAILFFKGSMKYFPQGLPKIFPHLRALSVFGCGLLEISRADLRGFQSLEVLLLGLNELQSLPSDLFIGMNKLKNISFHENQIEFMSSHLFKPVIANGLKTIRFQNNKSINVIYDPDKSGTVSSIEELMKIIDTQCLKPRGDLYIEAFNISAASAIGDLWNSKALSDFTIIANERKFRVHKFVLAAHSLKFAAMFGDNKKEANELNIKDLNIEVVEAFLRFFYTGKVSDDVDALELFKLSNILEVPILKSVCVKTVIDSLQESNALQIFKLGHAYDCEEFKKKAFDEISRTFNDIDLSEDIMEKPESLEKLIEARTLKNDQQ